MARRWEAVEPELAKYFESMGAMKERKTKSAPLDLGSVTATRYGLERGSLPEYGEREPQKENKLEGEVEGEPVDDVDEALDDTAYPH